MAGGAAAQTSPGPYKPSFPILLTEVAPAPKGTIRAGHPAIADLGLTPGHKSLVFGTAGHFVYVVNYDGTVAPGFPITVPSEVTMSPSVGDLDGDGQPEIVVGYGSTFEGPTAPGGVQAIRRNGTVLWSKPAFDFNGDGIPEAVITSPAIGDVDGDGAPEVVWGGVDGRVHVVNGATGDYKTGWPVFVRDSILSSPALHDIDGDGRLDVAIGVDAHLEGPPYNTPDGGCLHVYRYDGSEVAGFPQCKDQVFYSSPAVGDINGDGKPEIVIGTGTYYPNRTHAVYAFTCTGAQAAGWPVAVEGEVFTSPALGDLDSDGIPEVIVTDNNSLPSTTFHLYAFKGNGTQLFKKVPKSFFGNTANAGDPMIADVYGDSAPEILLATNTEICVFSSTGVQLSDDGTHAAGSFSYYTNTALAAIAAGDMESDGDKIEVVAISGEPFPSPTRVRVLIWNPKAPTAASWGQFHQNEKRTGVVPGTPGCSTANPPLKFYSVSPCRIIDTRNPDGPLGGPILSGNQKRVFGPITGACSIPATAVALAVNVTVTATAATGSLRVYSGNLVPTTFNSVSFTAGRTRACTTMLRLATNGAGTIGIANDSAGSTHVIVDVSGYLR
jgi:hypothetical protein